MSNLIEFFTTLDIHYVYIFLGSIIGVSLLFSVIKLIKLCINKNKKEPVNNKNEKFDYIKEQLDNNSELQDDRNVNYNNDLEYDNSFDYNTESFETQEQYTEGYNNSEPQDNRNVNYNNDLGYGNSFNCNTESFEAQEQYTEEYNENTEQYAEGYNENAAQCTEPTENINSNVEEFNYVKTGAINAYNHLYDTFLKNNYSVDLSENTILANYYNAITNTQDINFLRNLTVEIEEKSKVVVTELIQNRKTELQKQCSNKLVELEKICSLTGFNGKHIIDEFKSKLLNIDMFSTIEEYEKINADIEQNILYLRSKYSKMFQQKFNNAECVDVTLVKSLELLNCDPNERDLKKIKSNYYKIIKKYHPDLNKTKDTHDKFVITTNAYDYIKKHLV